MKITLTVNGSVHTLEVPPNRMLLAVLREDLDLTGTKYGCGTGDCGSCVVEVDGRSVNSCLMLAAEADGSEITTVEGLAEGVMPGQLDVIQQAFIDAGAIQCGYCTPGFLMTARAFLRTHPDPSDEEIAETFEGNLCRCTGYVKIKQAIHDAARTLREGVAS
jgi:aerobic carbon-monoxide dehydrogenase small subunit